MAGSPSKYKNAPAANDAGSSRIAAFMRSSGERYRSLKNASVAAYRIERSVSFSLSSVPSGRRAAVSLSCSGAMSARFISENSSASSVQKPLLVTARENAESVPP